MHRIGLLCGAFALAIFATPSPAQQGAPDQPSAAQPAAYQGMPTADQTQNSVPPAPPPDMRPTPGGPPPFPPMSKRPPQHRRVDVGGGHHSVTRSHHRAASGHHKAKPAHHKLTREEKNLRYCDNLSHRKMMHNRTCVTLMKKQKAKEAHHRLTRTEKNVRYCDSLSHRKVMRNRTCVALMKKQEAAKKRAAKHQPKHPAKRHHRKR